MFKANYGSLLLFLIKNVDISQYILYLLVCGGT